MYMVIAFIYQCTAFLNRPIESSVKYSPLCRSIHRDAVFGSKVKFSQPILIFTVTLTVILEYLHLMAHLSHGCHMKALLWCCLLSPRKIILRDQTPMATKLYPPTHISKHEMQLVVKKYCVLAHLRSYNAHI